jgi:hypothetical protein
MHFEFQNSFAISTKVIFLQSELKKRIQIITNQTPL